MTDSPTWVDEGRWEGGRDRRAVKQTIGVRTEMRRRDSQSSESYSAANQLAGRCQTNSEVADSGFSDRARASEQPLAAVGRQRTTVT